MKSILSTIVSALVIGMFSVSAQAQTTTPTPKATSFGYAITDFRSETFTVPVARIKGNIAINPKLSVAGEYNLVSNKPIIMAGTYGLGSGISLTGGEVLTITTYDIPGPWNSFFSASPVWNLNPQFNDLGGGLEVSRGMFSGQFAIYNGEGPMMPNTDKAVDLAGRLAVSHGPADQHLSASIVWQGERHGDRLYKAAFVSGTSGFMSVNLAGASREDGKSAFHCQVVGSSSLVNVGVQYESTFTNGDVTRGGTLSIQRPIGWRSRISATCHVEDGNAPTFYLRLQQAVKILG